MGSFRSYISIISMYVDTLTQRGRLNGYILWNFVVFDHHSSIYVSRQAERIIRAYSSHICYLSTLLEEKTMADFSYFPESCCLAVSAPDYVYSMPDFF